MASNHISSSPTTVIAMSSHRLELVQTPTIPPSFVESLDFTGSIRMTRSDAAAKDMEWLESWNPSKVSTLHNGPKVTKIEGESDSIIDLNTSIVKLLTITAVASAIEAGNMNASSLSPLVSEEAQFSELPILPSEFDKSSCVGRVGCKVNIFVYLDDHANLRHKLLSVRQM